MKTYFYLVIFLMALALRPADAQENQDAAGDDALDTLMATNASGDYTADLAVVRNSQRRALAQAREMLAGAREADDRAALEAAIKQMESAQSALRSALKSRDQLPGAIAAEQAAYQALLKATPREFRMSRSRKGGQGNSSGNPDQRQADQLDLNQEANRYETEHQAEAQPNAQQREQTQVADRLKELAQRQQDLNDRVRELQTALQAAHSDGERADIENQLKRLEDEQRQMLASVDDLRQQLEQSPNAGAESDTRRQLEQTRNEMQRASEALKNQSASQALAAGTRAQQGMQNLRDNLRQQTSGQFSLEMRQLRGEARDLAKRENEIARGLDALNNGGNHALDDSAQRQQVGRQIDEQQSALTNLLAGIKEVTEKAETTEPLLAKQLYDTLRRANQMHTDNLLDMGSQLVDRGFLPQASAVERTARTNVTELVERVTRAADSVLGSQEDSLRYAQKQLDDLTRQLEREIGGGTNLAAQAGAGGAREGTNRPAGSGEAVREERDAGGRGTNGAPNSGGIQPGTAPLAGNNPGGRQNSGENPGAQRGGQTGDARQASQANAPDGAGDASGGATAQGGQREAGGQPREPDSVGGATGGPGGLDRLRQIAERAGRGDVTSGAGGPITGGNYSAWSQQLREVESALDSPDLRNQLAAVRDRAGALRAEYRAHHLAPSGETVREQLLMPLSQVQIWVREELARKENSASLTPLDRDPVPGNYSELVRKYYEKLGSAQ